MISVSYLDAVPGTKARWPWLNRRVGVLGQFPWDTDAVTEVCMTGFRWETNDHTSEGKKEGSGIGKRPVTLPRVRIKA